MSKHAVLLALVLVLVLAALGAWYATTSEAQETVTEPVPAASAAVTEPRPDVPMPQELDRSQVDTKPARDAAPPPPALELGPVTELSVLDASTSRHTLDNELRIIPRVFGVAMQRIPGDGLPFSQLGVDLDSPIRIRGLFRDPERSQLVGIRLEPDSRHADDPAVDKTMSQELAGMREYVLYVRAPERNWVRIEIDLQKAATRQVELVAGSSIIIRFENWQPDAYLALGLEPHLELTAVNGSASESLHVSWLGKSPTPRAIALDGVAVGTEVRVEVALGHRFAVGNRTILATTFSIVEAAAENEILVVLEDPPTPAPTAKLDVFLRLPEFDGRSDAVLSLYDQAYVQGRASAEIKLSDMKRTPGRGEWSQQLVLPVGRYHAKLWPLQCSWIVDLSVDGARADFDVHEICTLEIRVVDQVSAALVHVDWLFWRREERMKGMQHYAGFNMPATERVGRFVIHTTPGKLDISIDQRVPRLVGRAMLEVGQGLQRQDLIVAGPMGVRFEFRLGDTVLPRGAVGLPRIELTRLDGEGRVMIDRMATESTLEVSDPGRYSARFDFKANALFRYDGEPVEVDIHVGQMTELVVALEKVRKDR